ncbi:MAG: DUF5009 domain-containing protein [Planctomycetota bacterium]|nr:DUF5009 domain-containing protein [Planctomycetota bacterium]
MSDEEKPKRGSSRAAGHAGSGADPASALELSALPTDRLTSADAYRGFVMFLMMAEVLRFSAVAKVFPESSFWRFLAFHQSHVEWTGCSLHDLIQPSFSFLVGLSLPFSIASRQRRGQGFWHMFLHAELRAVVLVLLGVWLRSTHASQTNWTFEDTLSQIGLGYVFLFLLGFTSLWGQLSAFLVIIVGYWGAFAWYQLPGPDFDYAAVKVPADWAEQHNFSGFMEHWNKNSNLAWKFDAWFLNLFPREKPWEANGGGYSTLSFIPTLGTMILGLLAGGLARLTVPGWKKLLFFATAGVACLGLGYGAEHFGICPSVKRIWTPAWTLFSGGWCFLLLALFYAILDLGKFRGWAFPLVVIGMNSIAAYCLAHGFDAYLTKNLQTHFGPNWTKLLGEEYATLLHGGVILTLLWLILFWMYRRKVFVRI